MGHRTPYKLKAPDSYLWTVLKQSSNSIIVYKNIRVFIKMVFLYDSLERAKRKEYILIYKAFMCKGYYILLR
ncbi:hypothetical protein Stok01_02817 [Sulfurisphaera tokodaii]